ncbi:MAG: helix-turn-helix transcriptional regulator [Candidatus Nitrospinota bacterium M3_3B_026]
MSRNAQVIRFMALLRELESARGLYVPKMAERLGVTRRTIYRDLRAIEDSGYPLYQDKGDSRTVWRFVDSYRSSVRELSISTSEMLALWSALGFLRNLKGTPFEADLGSLTKKIESLNNNGNGLKRLGKTLLRPSEKGTKEYSASGETIRLLLKGILESRALLLDYYSFHSEKVKKLEIHPYHLLEHKKGLYLFCHSMEHGKVITLAVERIKKIGLTGKTFEPDVSLDFESYANSGFGIYSGAGREEAIELIFSKNTAKYIRERRWHPTQRLKEMKDGRVKLSFKACVDFELIHWIRGFGEDVEVIRPEELKNMVDGKVKS